MDGILTNPGVKMRRKMELPKVQPPLIRVGCRCLGKVDLWHGSAQGKCEIRECEGESGARKSSVLPDYLCTEEADGGTQSKCCTADKHG